uniref:glycerol kinase n=1 Tax=Palpitomonas bilix TaxID=652834 RepID=A0A7S3D4Q1_9EUKA
MSDCKYIGAIDQGTTSTRFIVFDEAGAIVSVAQEEHSQIYKSAGWVEHDPDEIWEKTCKVAEIALKKAGITGENLAAVGVTNQRETTMVWSRSSGKPLHNAIVWMDTRTKDICEELEREGHAEDVKKVTGLPIATYFSAPKLLWLRRNVPAVHDALESKDAMVGTIDSWLVYKLSGGKLHATDSTNASRTMLMNLRTLQWEPSLLDLFGVPAECLPSIMPSKNDFGVCSGMPALQGVRLGGILGDQQASLFGQLCLSRGDTKCTYGTGCFMMMNVGSEPIDSQYGLLATVGYQLSEKEVVYALEGSVANAGSIIQWLRDQLGIIQDAKEVEELARKAGERHGSNKDIYFVPAFSGLFAPHWRKDARGVLVGLTHRSDRFEIARAALDATAYQVVDVAHAMTNDSKLPNTVLRVDGGMTHNNILMQFQSDILGTEVVRPKVAETTALGAAYTAGLCVGFWKNTDELLTHWEEAQRWKPSLPAQKRNDLLKGWGKALSKSLDWIQEEEGEEN